MSIAALVAALCLIALAVGHSLMGERLLIGPLLAADPWPAVPIGRTLGRRTLRFAWHLTSVAWLGLAALMVAGAGSPVVPPVVGAVLLASGAGTFAASRGRHFAWALFLAGAIAAGAHLGLFRGEVLAGLAWASGAAFGAVALLHVAWAFGLRWGIGAALPTVDERPVLTPGRGTTLLVALLLALAAWLALGLGGALPPPPAARWLALAGALVLAARTVGDFSTVGLSKRVLGTPFARRDDLLFTPLCFCLGACLLLLAVGGG